VLLVGGSLAALTVNFWRDRGKGLVSCRLVLDCLPMMVQGSILGLMAKKVLPPFLTMLLIVSILSLTFYKAYLKLFKAPHPQHTPLPPHRYTSDWHLTAVIISILAICLGWQLVRGTERRPSLIGIEYMTGWYWGVTGVEVLALAVVQGAVWRGMGAGEGRMLVAGFSAGVVGAVLGIGGGIILLPSWISGGVPPARAVPTSSYFILWNSLFLLLLEAWEGSY
jgi:uncharacterized membrane protein YfcA